MMWRRDGQLVSYMYYPGHDNSECGEDWNYSPPVYIEDDKWYRITMYVKVNDDGV